MKSLLYFVSNRKNKGEIIMAKNFRGKSFLKLLDFSSEDIRYLLDLSKNFKDMKEWKKMEHLIFYQKKKF